jgi:cation diffusion facilitator CzcD-associated flavoprotein CzcO
MLDLAIVGAGPAGIATAYFLRDLDLDVTIFDAAFEVGTDANCPRRWTPVKHGSTICVPRHSC